MSRSPSTIDDLSVEATWRSLEQQLDELLRLTPDTTSAAEFRAALLSRLVPAVAARCAILWTRRDSRSLSWEALSIPDGPQPPEQWQIAARWGVSQDDTIVSNLEPRLAEHTAKFPRRLADAGTCATPSAALSGIPGDDWWSELTPVSLDGNLVAVIEVFWPRTIPSSVQRNVDNILAAYAEAASEYFRRGAIHDLRAQLEQARGCDSFALGLQRLPDERSIAFTVANELGRLLDCDRVTVLTRGRRWQVMAVSRSDTFDRRSPIIRGAERLAALVARDAQPSWLHATTQLDLLPAAYPWQGYLEESSTRSAALLPLVGQAMSSDDNAGCTPIGALLIERFAEQPFTVDEQQRVGELARHAAAAFSRVRELRRNSWLEKLARKSTLIGAALVLGLLGAAFVPVDFEISARGELQPEFRQVVFAPADGLVRQLQVHDGAQVAAGAMLLEIKNDDLDFELTRLSGELQTTRQQLASVQAARLEAAAPTPTREHRGQLAAEEERLKQVLLGLEQQHQQQVQRRGELTIRSSIAGRVITANVEQMLRSRPLRRGQQLLTIADESGPWVLELRVADQDIGHLLAARRDGAPLQLRFVLATQPTIAYRGTVHAIADWTDVDESGDAGVRVTARIEDLVDWQARPGATVTAKVLCGRERLGYVWLRDLIEKVRTWL